MHTPIFNSRQDFSVVDIGVGTLLILLALFINKLGVAGNALFFSLIAVMAIGPVKLAFEGFVLSVLALCTNQAIVLKTVLWAYGRFAVLLGLSGRFLVVDQAATGYGILKETRYITLCMFCGAAAFTSLVANNRPEIALLKVFLFWFSLSGLWSAVNHLRLTKTDVAPWMLKIVGAVCCLNVLSIPLGIANNFRDEGFTHGLYNLGFYHSQTVGPACGMMTVYLVSIWLFTAYRNRWLCIPLGLVLVWSMYLSGSRTGLLTLAAGLGSLMAFTMVWQGAPWQRIRLNISRSALVGASIAGVTLVLLGDLAAGGKLSTAATRFIAKGRSNVETFELKDVMSSRQGLIDRSMANFWESPVIGNGFQMYGDREATQNTTIMTSQVEKGFLPAAILEETGVFGTVFFVLFLASCLSQYVCDRNIPGISSFIALLAMNLGECSFFSFAGHGGLIWCFVAAADLLGVRTKVATHQAQAPARVSRPRPTLGRSAAAL